MWLRRAVNRYAQAVLLRPALSKPPPWAPPSSSYCYSPKKVGKVAPLQERRMVDRFRLCANGGDGGNGCCSFRRSRSDRFGRPDGGNGGRGGDVILECSNAVWDFSSLQHHLNAKRGGHGTSKSKIGNHGFDKVAQVPVGTVIHLVSGEIPSFVKSSSGASLKPWEIPSDAEVQNKLDHNDGSALNESAFLAKELDNSSSYLSNKFHKVSYSQKPSFVSSKSRTVEQTQHIQDFNSCHEIPKSEYDKEDEEYDDKDREEEEEGEEEEGEEEVQYSVAELTRPGQKIIVARGGEGGMGNADSRKDYKLKSVNHHDAASKSKIMEMEDESLLMKGKPGSECVLILELKSIADVGLVGMPNAGKSTLLGALSRANPVVGNYAFTTLRPNIGSLNYEDFFSVKVADIPGLIKGAHANRGLGHAFLRHIERTRVLAYVVDLAAALNGNKGIPPWEQLRDLVMELEYHQEGLSTRPSLIVANKIDEEGAIHVYDELKKRVRDVPIFPVCAVLHEGVTEVKAGLRGLIDGTRIHTLSLDKIIID